MASIKPIVCLSLLLALALPAGAQRKVSADVEVKSVSQGKLSTVTKSVYCTSNGRLVTLFRTPVEYYHVTNIKGETQFYIPASNQVMSQYDPSLSSNTELVMIFLGGHIDDLGLGQFGYRASALTREEGYVKRTFTASDPQYPDVEIVYEDYLPIYCAYTGKDGKLISKKYLSDYKQFGRFVLPLRVTDISYGNKRDSSIVRTLYSSVKVDVDDPNFDFQIPADAKPMKLDVPAK